VVYWSEKGRDAEGRYPESNKALKGNGIGEKEGMSTEQRSRFYAVKRKNRTQSCGDSSGEEESRADLSRQERGGRLKQRATTEMLMKPTD